MRDFFRHARPWLAALALGLNARPTSAADTEIPAALRVGAAFHAFDHLGGLSHQAEVAAACGVTVLYAGFGAVGYSGLPARPEFDRLLADERAYIRRAKAQGIKLALGYICATSIVGLEKFDRNWTPAFRAGFATAPTQWRQVGRDGQPLRSWYPGDYEPACMNNPDWRAYERFMVRQHLEAGYDGMFFDNPTVHPEGCYCVHCLARFAEVLAAQGVVVSDRAPDSVRRLAEARPDDFRRFRCTIARDFLADMRAAARTVNPRALVTCNNSLNSPGALYAQCRSYGYNLFELSKAEDWVVVEDMATQPRILPDGRTLEYGPTYRQLQAVCHGRPIVAVTIAEADYHTPPNLVRLAMAEAAANGASYLAWPTWPEKERPQMIAALRAEADFLGTHAAWLNRTQPRKDVALFLPFRRWLESERCVASELASELVRQNTPFTVVGETDFSGASLRPAKVLLVESCGVLSLAELAVAKRFEAHGGKLLAADHPGWMKDLRAALPEPSVAVSGPPTVRAYAHDQPGRSILHLLNLNVRRVSSFEDALTPAQDLRLRLWVPLRHVRSLRGFSAEGRTSQGPLAFTSRTRGGGTELQFTFPRLEVAALVVAEY